MRHARSDPYLLGTSTFFVAPLHLGNCVSCRATELDINVRMAIELGWDTTAMLNFMFVAKYVLCEGTTEGGFHVPRTVS